MSYNVLCDKYATRPLYGYCPSWALTWDYRKQALLKEILDNSADIISLQVFYSLDNTNIYSIMTPNIKGTDTSIFSIYSTLGTTSGSIFSRLFTALENNTLTSGLVKEHEVLCSSSPSLAASINSNYYKPFNALVLLLLYWKTVGVKKLIQYLATPHAVYISFSIPPLMLYFPFSTRTSALANM